MSKAAHLVNTAAIACVLGLVPQAASAEATANPASTSTSTAAPTAAPAAPSAPAATSAPALAEGREHFNRGLALYREANFGGARVEFQRAYDIAPSFRILFNLGQVAFELQDYAAAVTAFSRYLSEGGDKVPAPRRAEITKTLSDLEQRIGRIEVTTNLPGAEIAVDGVVAGVTPLTAPVVASVGRRSVTASLAGHIPVSKVVDVAVGDHAAVSLELLVPLEMKPVVAAPPPLAPLPAAVLPPPMAPPPPRSMTPVWALAGTTAALAGTATVFGILTVGANSTFNQKLGTFPGSPTDIANARSQVRTFAALTDIFGGVAVASAGFTVYLALTRKESSVRTGLVVGPSTATLKLTF
jgi:hypothetical protein